MWGTPENMFVLLIFLFILGNRLNFFDSRLGLIPFDHDERVAFNIRADVDYAEFMKDPQRLRDHIVAVSGLKDLQLGEFTYLGSWVSAYGTLSFDPCGTEILVM
jgi:hypothetical protein